jgi:ParB-like chromosome segregation protein Spo0J
MCLMEINLMAGSADAKSVANPENKETNGVGINAVTVPTPRRRKMHTKLAASRSRGRVSSPSQATSAPAALETPERLMEFHPLSEVFPMMGEEELSQLADDIMKHGLHDPVIRHEGKVLDGRNRYTACLRANVTPVFVDYEGTNPAAFVVSRNLQRRHLAVSQRAVAAAKLIPHLQKAARKRVLAGKGADGSGGRGKKRGPNPVEKVPQGLPGQAGAAAEAGAEPVNGRSRDLAAAILGVNAKYIDYVKTIQEKAPKEIRAIREGKKTISQVMREIKKSENGGEPEPLPKAVEKEVAKLKGERFQIIAADQFHLFDWASQHSEKALGTLLTATAEPDSVLFVTSQIQHTLPKTLGQYVFITWIILERAEVMDCGAFNMETRHELAAVYVTPETTLEPGEKMPSLIQADVLIERISKWFPDRKKLALFGDEAPKGWTLLERSGQL